MAFITSGSGRGFASGFFLADDEDCTRVTMAVAYNHAAVVTRADGRKVVPAGAIIPANGSTAKGILYEDIDVTDGSSEGSVVVAGVVYGDRLPVAAVSDAKSAMPGIVFQTSPGVYRPNAFVIFDVLDVKSAAGSASGDTKITVSGHRLQDGEAYVYKTDASTAPAAPQGTDLSAWTSWDGSADITATTSHKITIAVEDKDHKSVAAGSATVTSAA